MFAGSPRRPPPSTPYLTVLSTWFKPEMLTPLEEKVKRRTVVALRELNRQIEDARGRRDRLLEDTRQLLKEKSCVQAENQFFLDYLSKENEQCRKKQEELQRQYFRECGEIEQRRQELASRYTQRNADLQAQILKGRMTLAHLKKRLQALKPISVVKERQDMKIQTLEQEKEKIPGETAARDREAHLRFLQEKAFLEKQLEELQVMEEGGDINTKEFKRKAKALSQAAKQAHVEFCHGLNRENQQLQMELEQLSQEYWKLEATRSHLEKQQQQLKEEQWYLEALVRGRQRLQAQRERHGDGSRCRKERPAPNCPLNTQILNCPLGTQIKNKTK
uniref:coiled-coil domain-containing protein 121-like n=1 Tax=Jaculus jaculus TaxID=51337 RepID=UPI001E1B0CD6|nr:coiled-coil domain-containing protein 121-like [Jaculus jaculus]